MRRNTRLICGSILLFFALLIFVEGSEPLFALVFISASLALLYREVMTVIVLIIPVVRKLGTLIHKRAQKVARLQHCACCGALPVYMVTTCASTTYEGPPPEVLTLFVCQEHHPNPKIGTKAQELHARITKINPGITVERIYLHNPYSH